MQRELQRRRLGHLRQQCLRRGGVVGLCQIVRDVGGEPDRLVAVLGHPVLEQIRHAAGHLDLAHPRLVVGDEIAIVRVRRHRHRPGVRNRHRDGAQADGAADPQAFGEQTNRGDEAFPLQVRLQTGQQQKRSTETVAQREEVELRILVVGEVVGLEGHQRPTGPVVQQVVDGERGDEFGVHRVLEVIGGQPDGVPRVGEALKGMDQHRPAAVGGRQLGGRKLQFVHPVRPVVAAVIVSQGVPPRSIHLLYEAPHCITLRRRRSFPPP